MARKLAHIERVHTIQPIENADRIELVHVLGWQLIAKKGEFAEGDFCVYIEIDSRVPAEPRYDFLANKDYKIKTMKMRGVISQGIALPLNMFPELKNVDIGDDVTEKLGITKIITAEEKRLAREEGNNERAALDRARRNHTKFMSSWLGKFLMKHKWSRSIVLKLLGCPIKKPRAWPSWVAGCTKTDEERIENVPQFLGTGPYDITEKLDGSSATYALERKGGRWKFYVCSRNVCQEDAKQACYYDENIYWEQAFKYNIKEKLIDMYKVLGAKTAIVLQGEVVGPKVQSKGYQLAERDLYVYNLKVDGRRMNNTNMFEIATAWGFKTVPIIGTIAQLPETMEEMKAMAEGPSVIGPCLREGLVYRHLNGEAAFKNVAHSHLMEKGRK